MCNRVGIKKRSKGKREGIDHEQSAKAKERLRGPVSLPSMTQPRKWWRPTLSIVRPFHLILYSITQTKVKCELMYSIYHAFVARWDHSASSFSPTSPPSLCPPLPFLFSPLDAPLRELRHGGGEGGGTTLLEIFFPSFTCSPRIFLLEISPFLSVPLPPSPFSSSCSSFSSFFPSLPLEKLFRRRCTRKNDTSLFRGRNDENFNRWWLW